MKLTLEDDKSRIIYRKFLEDETNAFIAVKGETRGVTFQFSDGYDTCSLGLYFWNKDTMEGEYANFLGMMESIKFAANAAMDEAAGLYADSLISFESKEDDEEDEVQE